MPTTTTNLGLQSVVGTDPPNQYRLTQTANNLVLDAIGFMPIGAMAQWSVNADPVDPDGTSRWLICDGRAISKTTYATLNALYSAASYPYGSSGGNFNIPDTRGRVLVGVDSGGVHLSSAHPALAATAGEENHTLSSTEMPTHLHGVSEYVVSNTAAPSSNQVSISATGVYAPIQNNPFDYITFTNNAGSGGAHNNLQPYIAVNHIIRVL